MESKSLIIERLNIKHLLPLLRYYRLNKNHLEKWEPKKNEDFYSENYFKKTITKKISDVNKGKAINFVFIKKYINKIIAVSNYTQIKDGQCWLGYSISKKFEGKGLMKEGLLLTNNYIFKNNNIHTINAGCIVINNRSIKLLHKLKFVENKYELDFLEINGYLQPHRIYQLKKYK